MISSVFFSCIFKTTITGDINFITLNGPMYFGVNFDETPFSPLELNCAIMVLMTRLLRSVGFSRGVNGAVSWF